MNPKYLQASLSDVEEMYLLHAYRVSVSQSLREHPDHTVEAIKNVIEYIIKYEVMIPEKYETMPHDLRRHAVPAHMFLKEKYLPNGAFDKLKARLVAGGNWQAEGTYGDTSSLQLIQLRLTLINIMTVYELKCEAIDISCAFLSTPVLPDDKQQYVKLVTEVARLRIRLYPEYAGYLHEDVHMKQEHTSSSSPLTLMTSSSLHPARRTSSVSVNYSELNGTSAYKKAMRYPTLV
ncbi:unnamed protein product [Sphagnum compactum]